MPKIGQSPPRRVCPASGPPCRLCRGRAHGRQARAAARRTLRRGSRDGAASDLPGTQGLARLGGVHALPRRHSCTRPQLAGGGGYQGVAGGGFVGPSGRGWRREAGSQWSRPRPDGDGRLRAARSHDAFRYQRQPDHAGNHSEPADRPGAAEDRHGDSEVAQAAGGRGLRRSQSPEPASGDDRRSREEYRPGDRGAGRSEGHGARGPRSTAGAGAH